MSRLYTIGLTCLLSFASPLRICNLSFFISGLLSALLEPALLFLLRLSLRFPVRVVTMVGVRHPQRRRSPRRKKGLIECCAKLRSTREMRANGWMVALISLCTSIRANLLYVMSQFDQSQLDQPILTFLFFADSFIRFFGFFQKAKSINQLAPPLVKNVSQTPKLYQKTSPPPFQPLLSASNARRPQ